MLLILQMSFDTFLDEQAKQSAQLNKIENKIIARDCNGIKQDQDQDTRSQVKKIVEKPLTLYVSSKIFFIGKWLEEGKLVFYSYQNSNYIYKFFI